MNPRVLLSSCFLIAAFASEAFTVTFISSTPMDGKVKGPDGTAVESYSCQVSAGGSTPTVTASPTSGCRLVGWSGDYASKNIAISVSNVTRDLTVNANFCALNKWRVSFSNTSGGRVEGQAIQYVNDLGSCSSVLATPDAGYDFNGWTGGVVTTANPLFVQYVSSDLDITASFSPTIYHDVVFTASTGGVLSGAAAQKVRDNGATDAVEAIPNTGYVFDKWSGDADGTVNPIILYNVRKNLSIEAVFIDENEVAKEDYGIFKAASITLSLTPGAAKFKTSIKAASAPVDPASIDGAALTIAKRSASGGFYKYELTAAVADALPTMPLSGSILVMGVGGAPYKSANTITNEKCAWKGVSGAVKLTGKRTLSKLNCVLQLELSGIGSGPVGASTLAFEGADAFAMSECQYSTTGSKWKVKIKCSDARAKNFKTTPGLNLVVTGKDGSTNNYLFTNSITRTVTAVRN